MPKMEARRLKNGIQSLENRVQLKESRPRKWDTAAQVTLLICKVCRR